MGRDYHPNRQALPPEWFIDYATNAEMIWSAVPGLGYVIANERFFVRDHTAAPLINASTWSLSLWGDGLRGAPTQKRPISLSYHQLRSRPSVEATTFIECAGNRRSFFASQQGTPAPGTQGDSVPSGSPNGAECVSPRFSSGRGFSRAQLTWCPKGLTRTM